jgi:hypothetical protein
MKYIDNKIYCYLDLPISMKPKEEITTAECLFDNETYLEIMNRNDHNGLTLCRYKRNKVNETFIDDIVLAIPELEGHIRDVGLQKIYNECSNPAGSIMQPHTDGNARGTHCIQWLFDSGGTDVHTTWYTEGMHPTLRPPEIGYFSFANLRPIEDVIFDVNRWVIFRTDIIHSVQTIYSSREALTIGFTNDRVFETIINKYGITNQS